MSLTRPSWRHRRAAVLALWAVTAVLLPAAFFPACAQDENLNWNAFGTKVYTIESPHFSINYTQGLEHIAREAGVHFEHLYGIFSKTYGLTLPAKTKVLVVDGEITNGFTDPIHNFITIWVHDFDINERGTHDWLKGVITHEYAHEVSISSSFKFAPQVPFIQLGYFSHPNDANRVEALHVFSSDVLPPWFSEGIAQYEDSRHGSDSWDTHRDMILRSLTVSHNLLSWDRMCEFAGKGQDFEKTYNHGFSLVRYIAQTWGYDKVVAMLHDCQHIYRLDFDKAVKAVLGITGRQLYAEWKASLEHTYGEQIKKIGKQVYGVKINKDGYDNYWPKFSPDGKKIFFIGNGKADYSFYSKSLYSYSLVDTVKEDKRIKEEKGISTFYSIHPGSGLIAYTSMKSPKSIMPPSEGGDRAFDAFIDTLPSDKPKFAPFKRKFERQVTKRMRVFGAVFSPKGDKIACIRRVVDKFSLCIMDTSGKNCVTVYPDTVRPDKATVLKYIYSLDWSADGRHIAISYIDTGYRKIGIYDTLSHTFVMMKNGGHDDRDPRYAANGRDLYFSSDRTGIFNIYKCNTATGEISRLTNVSGGAFAPDVSPDQKRLVCANYDKDGYGIYLLDTVRALDTLRGDSSLFAAADTVREQVIGAGVASEARPYSYFPNMFMILPTVIMEEAVPELNNVFTGRKTFKAGALAFWDDALSAVGMGSQIGAYLFLEPDKILQFISLDQGFIGRRVNYDLGAFASTQTLPVDLSFDLQQRGITETDYIHWTNDSIEPLNYQIALRDIDLMASHPLVDGINLHVLGSYNWYEVFLMIDQLDAAYKPLVYYPAQGFRLGGFLSLLMPEHDQRTFISPRGLAARLEYNFWNQRLLNEKGITFESNGALKENYDTYKYHELALTLKSGMATPWYDKNDLYAEVNVDAVVPGEMISNKIFGTHYTEKELPSYYKPVEWIKGYAYYFRDTLKSNSGTDSVVFDTVLVTGNAVASLSLSYRFPLWPFTQIGWKFWFLNIDQLYGAVNLSAGASWGKPSDMLTFRKEDWISSAGAELRLKARSFGLPMAIDLRYDYGFNRPAPYGGQRFTFSLGFDFDDWQIIEQPNYYACWLRK